MTTYVAMLRGINVSGQKKIKMVDLRAHLEEVGFKNIQTYIQSGNIIFEHTSTTAKELENTIEQKLEKEYGFHVPTLIKTPAELTSVIKHNPFKNEEEKRLYVTFLYDLPEPEKLEKLEEVNYEPEQYIVDQKNIYFFSPLGYGNAKMNNNFFEKKLKTNATTRNWNTVNKLVEMAKK